MISIFTTLRNIRYIIKKLIKHEKYMSSESRILIYLVSVEIFITIKSHFCVCIKQLNWYRGTLFIHLTVKALLFYGKHTKLDLSLVTQTFI